MPELVTQIFSSSCFDLLFLKNIDLIWIPWDYLKRKKCTTFFCPLYYTRPSINSHICPSIFLSFFPLFFKVFFWARNGIVFVDRGPWMPSVISIRQGVVSSTCGTLSKKKVRLDDQAGRRSFGQGQTQVTWEPSRWFYEESSTNPKSNRIAIAYLYSLGGSCKVRIYTIQPALLTTLLGNSNHPASKWNTNFTIYTHIIGLLPVDVVRL